MALPELEVQHDFMTKLQNRPKQLFEQNSSAEKDMLYRGYFPPGRWGRLRFSKKKA